MLLVGIAIIFVAVAELNEAVNFSILNVLLLTYVFMPATLRVDNDDS